MIRNSEVVKEFCYGNEAYGSNLYSHGDKLFSYNTCIVEFYNGKCIINNTYYSNTTSRHLNMFKTIVKDYMNIINVNNIPRNTKNLHNFIDND